MLRHDWWGPRIWSVQGHGHSHRSAYVPERERTMPDVPSRSDAAADVGVTSTESWIHRSRVTWTYVGIMILTIAGVWFFRAVVASIFTFVIGGFLAFLLRPVVSLFMRWKLSRGLAVLTTSLLLVLFLALALAVIVPQVAAEVQQFAAAIPSAQRAAPARRR